MKITELTYKMTIDGDASNRDFRADLEAEILECAQRVADDHGLDLEIQAVEEVEERQVPHPEYEALRRPHYPAELTAEE